MVLNVIYEIAKDALHLAADTKKASTQRDVVAQCLHMECQINLDLLGLIKMEGNSDPDYMDVIRELRVEILGAILATADSIKVLGKSDHRQSSLDNESILQTAEDKTQDKKSAYELASYIFRKTTALKAYANFGQKGQSLKNVRVKQRLVNLRKQIVELSTLMAKARS